jgi:hypothetical protein
VIYAVFVKIRVTCSHQEKRLCYVVRHDSHVTGLRLGIKYGRSFLRQLCLRGSLHTSSTQLGSLIVQGLPYNTLLYSAPFVPKFRHNDLQKLPHDDVVPVQPARNPNGLGIRAPAPFGSQSIPIIQQRQQCFRGCSSFASVPPPTHSGRPFNTVRYLLRYPRCFPAFEHPRGRPRRCQSRKNHKTHRFTRTQQLSGRHQIERTQLLQEQAGCLRQGGLRIPRMAMEPLG